MLDRRRYDDGTVMGTPAYMSPEQTEGKPLDVAVRHLQFWLGAVRAAQRAAGVSRRELHLRSWPRFCVTSRAPLDAPAALQAIVKRCLAKPPAQRYQTVAEAARRLGQAAQTGTASHAPAPSPCCRSPTWAADKDDEYFSDGLAEEIINFLAQIPGLKVTARTSAFAFKGKTEDIRKIAETLGVSTVLEGSVRRSGIAPPRHGAADQRRATAIISGPSATTARWRTCSTCRTKLRRPSRPRCK